MKDKKKLYNPHEHHAFDVMVQDCERCGWGKLYQRCRAEGCKELACDGYCTDSGTKCCECWDKEISDAPVGR